MGRIFRASAGKRGFKMSRRDCLLRRGIYLSGTREGRENAVIVRQSPACSACAARLLCVRACARVLLFCAAHT